MQGLDQMITVHVTCARSSHSLIHACSLLRASPKLVFTAKSAGQTTKE